MGVLTPGLSIQTLPFNSARFGYIHRERGTTLSSAHLSTKTVLSPLLVIFPVSSFSSTSICNSHSELHVQH